MSILQAARPPRSQFSIPRKEFIRNAANRFTYSTQYVIAYAVLTVISIITVAISLSTPKGCPPVAFYFLELFVLLALTAEVSIRIFALQARFFTSWWNVIDAFLMLLCIVTFIFVFAGCSKAVRQERISSTLLLVIRNGVQLIRFLIILRRNRINFKDRKTDISLEDVELHGGALPLAADYDNDAEPIFDLGNDSQDDDDDDESQMHSTKTSSAISTRPASSVSLSSSNKHV